MHRLSATGWQLNMVNKDEFILLPVWWERAQGGHVKCACACPLDGNRQCCIQRYSSRSTLYFGIAWMNPRPLTFWRPAHDMRCWPRRYIPRAHLVLKGITDDNVVKYIAICVARFTHPSVSSSLFSLYSSTTCRLPRHEVLIIYSIYLRSCIACDSSVSIYKYLEIRQTGKRQMVK